MMANGTTARQPGDARVMGVVGLDVPTPSIYAVSAIFQQGFKQGLANLTGVPLSVVTAAFTVVSSRRLDARGRRLTANLNADYTILIPAAMSGPTAQSLANDARTALAATDAQTSLMSQVNAALQGTGFAVTAVESITAVVDITPMQTADSTSQPRCTTAVRAAALAALVTALVLQSWHF